MLYYITNIVCHWPMILGIIVCCLSIKIQVDLWLHNGMIPSNLEFPADIYDTSSNFQKLFFQSRTMASMMSIFLIQAGISSNSKHQMERTVSQCFILETIYG